MWVISELIVAGNYWQSARILQGVVELENRVLLN